MSKKNVNNFAVSKAVFLATTSQMFFDKLHVLECKITEIDKISIKMQKFVIFLSKNLEISIFFSNFATCFACVACKRVHI